MQQVAPSENDATNDALVKRLWNSHCREWRFYEAEFVKTRCENSLCFIFCSFLPTSDNNSPLWLWCLIIAAAFTPQ
jgi:hypothetical protein